MGRAWFTSLKGKKIACLRPEDLTTQLRIDRPWNGELTVSSYKNRMGETRANERISSEASITTQSTEIQGRKDGTFSYTNSSTEV